MLWTLVPSFFIGSSSFLQIIWATVKSWISSKFGQNPTMYCRVSCPWPSEKIFYLLNKYSKYFYDMLALKWAIVALRATCFCCTPCAIHISRLEMKSSFFSRVLLPLLVHDLWWRWVQDGCNYSLLICMGQASRTFFSSSHQSALVPSNQKTGVLSMPDEWDAACSRDLSLESKYTEQSPSLFVNRHSMRK